MAYSKELEQRIDTLVGESGLDKRSMFGGIAYFRQGNMCFGIYRDYLIVRLGSAAEAEPYLAEDHVRPMDITGRPMRGWVMAAPEAYPDATRLKAWLVLGDKVARGLPPK